MTFPAWFFAIASLLGWCLWMAARQRAVRDLRRLECQHKVALARKRISGVAAGLAKGRSNPELVEQAFAALDQYRQGDEHSALKEWVAASAHYEEAERLNKIITEAVTEAGPRLQRRGQAQEAAQRA